MNNWEYFIMLGGCLVTVSMVGWYLGVLQRVFADWRRLVVSLGVVFVVFSVWDWWAIIRGHWWFNADYVTGVRIWGVPVEELVFFLIIPFAGVVTWEMVGKVTRRLKS